MGKMCFPDEDSLSIDRSMLENGAKSFKVAEQTSLMVKALVSLAHQGWM
jgi:hypothetical protein